jgi:hypothetical protein
MRSAYRNLFYSIAALVVLQAGFIAWAFFGMSDWITNDNGVVNKELLECEGDCEQEFFAEWGFAFHMFFVGLLLIPLISLITLIVSFFSKVPGAPKWAGVNVVLVILQVFVIPALSREVDPIFGALHGINAMVILGVALMAAKRAGAQTAAPADVAAAV